jgi:protein-tyrosine phosphatase
MELSGPIRKVEADREDIIKAVEAWAAKVKEERAKRKAARKAKKASSKRGTKGTAKKGKKNMTVSADDNGNFKGGYWDKDTQKWVETNSTLAKYKWCRHHGDTPVFTIKLKDGRSLPVSAAARSDLRDWYPAGTILLNCTGIEPAETITVPRGLEVLQQYSTDLPYITINWSDGGAPPVTIDFWTELPKVLLDAGYKRLLVYCMGSHGRTGTALAALAMVHMKMLAPAAVRMIRDKHCTDCVETYSQTDYLFGLEADAFGLGILESMTDKDEIIIPAHAVRATISTPLITNPAGTITTPLLGNTVDGDKIVKYADAKKALTYPPKPLLADDQDLWPNDDLDEVRKDIEPWNVRPNDYLRTTE